VISVIYDKTIAFRPKCANRDYTESIALLIALFTTYDNGEIYLAFRENGIEICLNQGTWSELISDLETANITITIK
jgi:hypothetical protein